MMNISRLGKGETIMQKAKTDKTKNPLGDMKALLKHMRPFLLGVTGGIASGKTTVVQLLEEKGAPVIDFDVIARVIVEPGRPAWKDILACFGEQVLRPDQSVDREKLSNIVFKDPEKRKRLEGFTHPRIDAEFVRQVHEIGQRDPNAVIQVDVPLLIEIGLQHLFHRILVVHVPREVQIERLIRRDRISRKKAADILRAQMPLDEKTAYADFVIHNEGTLEEMKRQVDEVWKKIKEVQAAG